MTATAVAEVQSAVDAIDNFEDELKALISNNDAPAGVQSLQGRAQETYDRLIELSAAGIRLELNSELRKESNGFMLAAVQQLHRAVKAADDNARMSFVADALIELEAVRHILRDGLDHEPLRTGRQASGEGVLTRGDAVAEIQKWLPRLTQSKQAEILGIGSKEVSRWRNDTAANPASRRAELAVEIVGILRHSWTDEGVARWFEREHPYLDGKRPVDVIEDPDFEHLVLDAARSGRAQTAT